MAIRIPIENSNFKTIVNPCGEWYDPVVISGVYDNTVEKLEIPSTLGGAPVDGITKDAFRGMPNLKEVEIDDSLLYLYDRFIEYPEIYKKLRKKYKDKETEYIYKQYGWLYLPDETDSYESLYIGNQSLENVIIPEGIKNITNAFANSSVKRIIIPESVEMMDGALAGCDSLEEIVIACAYDKGAIFGGKENMSVKKVACFNDALTIVGSTPNATWYVPYAKVEDYQQLLNSFSEDGKCISCERVTRLSDYKTDCKLLEESYKIRLKKEREIPGIPLLPIQFSFFQKWQLTHFGMRKGGLGKGFVVCDLETGKKIDNIEPVLNRIAEVMEEHEVIDRKKCDWDTWTNESKVIFLIRSIIDIHMLPFLLYNKELEEPGSNYEKDFE